MTTKATAIVNVTLEMRLTDTWGGDCPVDQVMRQARNGAEDTIRRKLSGDSHVRLVKEASVVKVVLTQE